jgi:hypothetical protein
MGEGAGLEEGLDEGGRSSWAVGGGRRLVTRGAVWEERLGGRRDWVAG